MIEGRILHGLDQVMCGERSARDGGIGIGVMTTAKRIGTSRESGYLQHRLTKVQITFTEVRRKDMEDDGLLQTSLLYTGGHPRRPQAKLLLEGQRMKRNM